MRAACKPPRAVMHHSKGCRAAACRGQGCGDLYAAFNAHDYAVTAPLPPPPAGAAWARVADSNLPPPRDFDAAGWTHVEASYTVAPFASVLLTAKA